MEPDPILFQEFKEDYDAQVNRLSYLQYLQECYEGLAGALRDDPPRDSERSELASIYTALAAHLKEIERMS